MSNSFDNATKKGIAAVATIAALALAIVAISTLTLTTPNAAFAEMLAQNIKAFALKSEPTTIQLNATANYPTFHYVLKSQPAHGLILSLNDKTGAAIYQPYADFDGSVDSFTYRIESIYNSGWFSNTAAVKIAVVKDWTAYYPAPVTPVKISEFIASHGLTAATTPEIPNVTNIEPYKQTPQGGVYYSNVKASWELSGQSWWSLTLGQKQYLMDNLPFQTGLFMGVYH